MAASRHQAMRSMHVSAIHLVGLGISLILGLFAGSAFWWASPEQAWNIFLAGFLWTLLTAMGTAIVRFMRERVQRGDWWHGIAIGCEMTFPLTTLYMLGVVLMTLSLPAGGMVEIRGLMVASRPHMLAVAPVFYTVSLVLAIVLGPLYALTSPFKRG